MGNCQAAEATTVVIQHPGSKVERIYWSVTAQAVMTSNPGHYVALVISSPDIAARTENGTPVRHLKLLRPSDTLILGQVYRLVSFEDVLKEFAAKKCMKLGKLLKEGGGLKAEMKKSLAGPADLNPSKPRLAVNSTGTSSKRPEQQDSGRRGNAGKSSRMGGGVGRHDGGGQWRPTLQSIAEVGT